MSDSVASWFSTLTSRVLGLVRQIPARAGLHVGLLLIPLVAAGVLLGITLRDRKLNEVFFVHGAYYGLSLMLLVYAGVRFAAIGETASPRAWLKENLPGIVVTILVSAVVLIAVTPEYRVLADEANLIGVSKNLYYQKTANFTLTGKWYFENYWSLQETTDRRPALYPFLINLLHVVRGYDPENGFHLNALLVVIFVFLSYRVAKTFGGELFGVVAAILVATTPNTLVAARSAGFDFLSVVLLVAVVNTLGQHLKAPSPQRLAVLVLELCLLAHVRYEGWALMIATLAALLIFRAIKWSHLRGFGWLYALVPLFLLTRYWQLIAKADDKEQPFSIKLFNISHFLNNTKEYLQLVVDPLKVGGPHAPVLMILAAAGCAIAVVALVWSLFKKRHSRFAVCMAVYLVGLLAGETALSFSYFWGKSVHPASCRLFVWLDTFVAFMAAWALAWAGRHWTIPVTFLGRRTGAPAVILASFLLFAMYVPVASEARFSNALSLSRDTKQLWNFFEKRGDTRIMILADRPGLFTIMNYGAQHITTMTKNKRPILELSRSLYQDLYLVQEVDLATHRPIAKFDIWPDVTKETVLEFQSDAKNSIRVVRVKNVNR